MKRTLGFAYTIEGTSSGQVIVAKLERNPCSKLSSSNVKDQTKNQIVTRNGRAYLAKVSREKGENKRRRVAC